MARRDKRKVEASLQKKGFVREVGGNHVVFLYITEEGKRSTVATHTSHGPNEDLGDPLLKAMAGQCKIEKSVFLDLVDCPLDRAGYESLLREKGAI